MTEHEKKPELSIVMPFFNKPQLVVEMIESIIANTYTDWELLAIDDGTAEDDAAFIHQRICDPRVQFIKRTEQPKGAQKCRNMGLDRAQGEYIIFFDSDDYITPTCLQNRVEAIKANPDMDFMITPLGTYADGKFTPLNLKKAFGYHAYKDDIAAFLRKTLPFVVVNNIYRTASLRERGVRWDESLKSLQDSDFNLQNLLKGAKYRYAECPPDYGYRIDNNPSSITSKLRSAQHFESHLIYQEKVFTTVQALHGHKYDYSLYIGVLFYILMLALETDKARIIRLVDIVKSHCRIYWILLRLQMRLNYFLCAFFKPSIALKVALLTYLVQRRLTESRRSKKIKEIYSRIDNQQHYE